MTSLGSRLLLRCLRNLVCALATKWCLVSLLTLLNKDSKKFSLDSITCTIVHLSVDTHCLYVNSSFFLNVSNCLTNFLTPPLSHFGHTCIMQSLFSLSQTLLAINNL